jgi:hypothetical protein
MRVLIAAALCLLAVSPECEARCRARRRCGCQTETVNQTRYIPQVRLVPQVTVVPQVRTFERSVYDVQGCQSGSCRRVRVR